MMIPFLFPLMLAEQGIRPPLAGYLETGDGWFELYGIRGNFQPGERLPAEVVSAAAFDTLRAFKTAHEVVIQTGESEIRRQAPAGRAWFAYHQGRLFVWLPESGELLEWSESGWRAGAAARPAGATAGFAIRDGRAVALERQQEALIEVEVESGALRGGAPTPLATFDSQARLWTAADTNLKCLDREWQFTESITALAALGGDWMVVAHGSNRSAVRCDSEEVTLLPEPRSPEP